MCQLKEIEWNILITLIYLSVNLNTFIPKEMKDCYDTLENKGILLYLKLANLAVIS